MDTVSTAVGWTNEYSTVRPWRRISQVLRKRDCRSPVWDSGLYMLHLSLPDFWDFEQRWCRFSTCTGETHIFHMTEKTQQLAPSVYIHQVILKQYMINVQFYFLPLVLPFLKLPCNPLLTSSGCCEPLDSHLIWAFTNETPSNKEKKERKKQNKNKL